MNNVLSAVNLTKIFTEVGQRIVVLENVNFAVQVREMIAIIGASGVGKTTLLQLLGGLDKPTSGEVNVGGVSFSGMSEKAKGELRNRDLGFVYQFHHLLPEFNALENVCLPLLIRGVAPKKALEKARFYIEQVELQQRFYHRVGELSGGERQRIAIARALVTEPKCVLADEPTGNLDEVTAGHVSDLLLRLNTSLGTSFVIVTHNKLLASRMQRTWVLANKQLRDEKNQ
ncbi:MAG: lipoprotein ABC transporter ATP-binding protein [Coxiella sp. RIFCSPHIGHO2_12_FULL_42_15]|nr:MAG: lipoprotein ABC transporter ATP-binding protein [Coxiella sp. RIFCSPHIGHO2_12_FULL_42_15]